MQPFTEALWEQQAAQVLDQGLLTDDEFEKTEIGYYRLKHRQDSLDWLNQLSAGIGGRITKLESLLQPHVAALMEQDPEIATARAALHSIRQLEPEINLEALDIQVANSGIPAQGTVSNGTRVAAKILADMARVRVNFEQQALSDFLIRIEALYNQRHGGKAGDFLGLVGKSVAEGTRICQAAEQDLRTKALALLQQDHDQAELRLDSSLHRRLAEGLATHQAAVRALAPNLAGFLSYARGLLIGYDDLYEQYHKFEKQLMGIVDEYRIFIAALQRGGELGAESDGIRLKVVALAGRRGEEPARQIVLGSPFRLAISAQPRRSRENLRWQVFYYLDSGQGLLPLGSKEITPGRIASGGDNVGASSVRLIRTYDPATHLLIEGELRENLFAREDSFQFRAVFAIGHWDADPADTVPIAAMEDPWHHPQYFAADRIAFISEPTEIRIQQPRFVLRCPAVLYADKTAEVQTWFVGSQESDTALKNLQARIVGSQGIKRLPSISPETLLSISSSPNSPTRLTLSGDTRIPKGNYLLQLSGELPGVRADLQPAAESCAFDFLHDTTEQIVPADPLPPASGETHQDGETGSNDTQGSSCTFQYSPWTDCNRTTKTQTRTVTAREPAGCEERQKPTLEQPCTPPPTEEELRHGYFNCLCRCSSGWAGHIGVWYDPEGKSIPETASSGPCFGGAGASGNTRRHFFAGPSDCAKGCWEGSWGKGTYDPAKADALRKVENRKYKKPLTVQIEASKNPADFGDIVDLTAKTAEGSGGYSWSWSGCAEEAKDDRAKVPFSQSCRPCTANVTVTDQDGDTASASLPVQCTALNVKLTKERPAENSIPVGDKATLLAEVFSGDQPAGGRFAYYWEPNPDVQYGDDPQDPSYETSDGAQSRNTALFRQTGPTPVWVRVLKEVGETKVTVGESEQILIEVISPQLSLKADKANPLIGETVVLTLEETPKLSDDLVSFWWEYSGEVNNPGVHPNTPNSRAWSYKPKNDKPVTITVHAKSKDSGEELDSASLTLTARGIQVSVSGPKIAGPAPMVWQPGVGLVAAERQIAEHQRVEFAATLNPSIEDARYQWQSEPDGCTIHAPSSRETGVTCSSTGSYNLSVTVKNADGAELGTGTGQLSVTVSQTAVDSGQKTAKQIETLLAQAREQAGRGRLDEALSLAKQALALDPAYAPTKQYVASVEKIKATLDRDIAAISSLIDQARLKEARSRLATRLRTFPEYPPLIALEAQLKRAETIVPLKLTLSGAEDSVIYGTQAELSVKGIEPPAPGSDLCAGRTGNTRNPFDECNSVRIDKTGPASQSSADTAAATQTQGADTSPLASVSSGSAKRYRYVWQSSPTLTFEPGTSDTARTKITYDRMGSIAVWCEVHQLIDGAWKTVGATDPTQVKVVAPSFELRFDPANGQARIGDEARVRILPEPAVATSAIDYRWLDPVSRMEYADNASEIGFTVKDTKPMPLKVLARVPHYGDAIAEISGSYTGIGYAVSISAPKARGPQLQMWVCDTQLGGAANCGMRDIPQGQFVTFQDIFLKAQVTPEPPNRRYQWAIEPAGSCGQPGIDREIRLNCSNTGTYTVSLQILGPDNGLLGQAETRVIEIAIDSDTIKRAPQSKAAWEKLQQAQQMVNSGKLDEAIALTAAALQLDPDNVEAKTLNSRWQQERQTIRGYLDQANRALQANRLDDAHHAIEAAQQLRANYPPLHDLERQIAGRQAALQSSKSGFAGHWYREYQDEKTKKAVEYMEIMVNGDTAEILFRNSFTGPVQDKATGTVQNSILNASDLSSDPKRKRIIRMQLLDKETIFYTSSSLQGEGRWSNHYTRLSANETAFDASGIWQHGPEGQTWTLTPKDDGTYEAVETGFGNARGTAVVQGRRIRVDYVTADGRTKGFYEVTVAADNQTASGRFADTQPNSGSSQWVRLKNQIDQVSIIGKWVLDMEWQGKTYAHDLNILSQDDKGAITGNGGHPAGGTYVFSWSILSGTYIDGRIRFIASYTLGAPGTTMNLIGSTHQDGSLSGTWTDNYMGENRNGTWSARPKSE